jgi:hypothetical protein
MKIKKVFPGMNDIIKSFAVELLGCGCSSDVFNSIEVSDDSFGLGFTGGKRILIGARLLIYLVPCDNRAGLADDIAFLMRRGKEERDGKKYNRFRLVLAASTPEELLANTRDQVQSLIHGDEKLHFHVLPSDNELVSGILR